MTSNRSLRTGWLRATCALLMLASLPAAAQTPTSYRSFDGTSLSLFAFEGQKVALLLDSATQDPAAIQQTLAAFDAAYTYYANVTGRLPTPFAATTYNGKLTIAQVPTTCGAGCGYVGFNGIEIESGYWRGVMDGIRLRGEFDQIVFYEFGRNFWFYTDQAELVSPDARGTIATGFAVALRFESMTAAGVTPAPFGGTPFAQFRSIVRGLVDQYVADPTLTFDNTIRVGVNPLPYGATDLFASFYLRLSDEFGPTFAPRFWRELGQMQRANTTIDAVDNMVVAATIAAGVNLVARFRDEWRWPVSAQGEARAAAIHPPATGIVISPFTAPILNGVWYDPARNGEGVFIVVGGSTSRPQVSITYYSRDPDLTAAWGVGYFEPVTGQSLVALDMLAPDAAGPGALKVLGRAELRLRNCRALDFSIRRTGSSTTESYSMVRLVNAADGVCPPE